MSGEDFIERLRACAAAGMSMNEAAAALDRSVSHISRQSKRAGIALRRVYDDAKLWPEIRKCAAKGMGITATMRKLKISEKRMNRFREANPDVQFKSGKGGRPRNLTPGNVAPLDPVARAAVEEMTAEQRADYRILVERGRYHPRDAVAAVCRPRTVARCSAGQVVPRRKTALSASPAAIERYLEKAAQQRRAVV